LLLGTAAIAAEPPEKAAIDQAYRTMMGYYQNRQFDQALPLAKEIVEKTRAAYGENSLEYAASLNNVAELQLRLGQFGEAVTLYRQALAIRQAKLPPDSPDLARSRDRLEQAQAMESRASAPAAPAPPPPQHKREAPPPDPRNTMILEANKLDKQIAEWSQQGNYEKALEGTRQLIAILSKVLPPDAPNFPILTGNMGQMLAQLKRYDEALPLMEKSVAGLTKLKGPDDKDVVAMGCFIADLNSVTGKVEAAQASYRKCLASLEKTHKHDDPEVQRILIAIGALERGKRLDAGNLPFNQDRMARPQSSGIPVADISDADHEAMDANDRKISELIGKKLFVEALPVAEANEALLEKDYGKDSIALLINLDAMAEILRGLKRDADAQLVTRRAQTIRDLAKFSR
jgi:tetratricopeptide (TPR) repeat protein